MTTTDPTEIGLLHAILSAPADDTPRLVYADWLEGLDTVSVGCVECNGTGKEWVQEKDLRDSGHYGPTCTRCHGTGYTTDTSRCDYGEFIRVQCELARTPVCGTVWEPGHPKGPVECRCCDLRRRERGLWERNGIAWDEPIQEVFNREWRERHKGTKGFWNPFQASAHMEWSWSRGFLSSLTCTAENWLKHCDQIYWHPEQTVVCPTCMGMGVYYRAAREYQEGCRDCGGDGCRGGRKGTGSRPRPFVATAQPLEKVVVSGIYEGFILNNDFSVTVKDWNVTQVTNTSTWKSPKWPGIEFTFIVNFRDVMQRMFDRRYTFPTRVDSVDLVNPQPMVIDPEIARAMREAQEALEGEQ